MDKKEIKIRVTQEENEKIKEKAASKGMSVSSYVKNAALQRRDKRTTTEIVMSLDAVYEVLEENKQMLEIIDKRLTSLFYFTEDYGPVTLYTETLIDADLSFRKLAREMTNLVMLISGDIDGGS